ncbi:C80 family cysteine peptidase, partial [Burkholderia ambifaria]|uniref:C80 family cysteine peptidase n=1 Tax=Burkholderia ambifaria TaxID=152480 RepID=UPI00158DC0A3
PDGQLAGLDDIPATGGQVKVQVVGHGDVVGGTLGEADAATLAKQIGQVKAHLGEDAQVEKVTLVGCRTACGTDEQPSLKQQVQAELAKQGAEVGEVKGRDTYVNVDAEGHKHDTTVDDFDSLPKTEKGGRSIVKTQQTIDGHVFTKKSTSSFDLYSLDNEKNVLLITAHGAIASAPEGALPDLPPPLPPRPGRDPSSTISNSLESHMVGRTLDPTRASVMVPGDSHFTPSVPIIFYVGHNAKLASESDSTLRRITQGRAIGSEVYPPNRLQTDYLLSDVSGVSQSFAGIKMERKDFIKAVMLEAEYIRNDSDKNKSLLDLHMKNKDLVMVSVPDVLMVKGYARLSEVLSDEYVKSYKKVFCSFCRAVKGEGILNERQHANTEVEMSVGGGAEVEKKVIDNLQSINRAKK